jgi:tRNA nucleotidyltransferase/poly(A) polymerase
MGMKTFDPRLVFGDWLHAQRYVEVSMQPVEKIHAEMPIPEDIGLLKKVFTHAGAKLYVVGGAVRDFVLSIVRGKPFKPKDYDLVTDLHPDKVLEMLHKATEVGVLPRGTTTREVGKSFGVVLVTINGEDYEIATFREDAKTGDGRRPDFVTFSTIDKDADRRDLTINALYYDLESKEVLDYHGGIQHLFSNRTVFVGDAKERIYEDKLRVMRFARFHCRVNAGGPETVDKDTRDAIRETKLRPEISEERIRDELIKGILSALDVENYLRILEDMGLLQQAFLGLKVVTELPYKTKKPEAVVAQILRYNEPRKAKEKLNELKYTVKEAEDIAFLIGIALWKNENQFVDFKRSQKRTSLGLELIRQYANLFAADKKLVQDMAAASYPTVRGEDVMAQTQLQGKALGDEMNRREVENFKQWRH